MPVFPLVGSSSVAPGRSRPSASAARTIHPAGRSFTEPVGLRSSSLAHSLTRSPGSSRARCTSGVSPTVSRTDSARTAQPPGRAAGHRGQDRHLVARAQRGVQAAGEPDVLVVDVHVDEPPQRPVLDDPRGQAVVAGLEVGEQLPQRRAAAVDHLGPAGEGSEDGRDAHARAVLGLLGHDRLNLAPGRRYSYRTCGRACPAPGRGHRERMDGLPRIETLGRTRVPGPARAGRGGAAGLRRAGPSRPGVVPVQLRPGRLRGGRGSPRPHHARLPAGPQRPRLAGHLRGRRDPSDAAARAGASWPAACAEQVDDPELVRRAAERLQAWAPGFKDLFLRLPLERVTGRRLVTRERVVRLPGSPAPRWREDTGLDARDPDGGGVPTDFDGR